MATIYSNGIVVTKKAAYTEKTITYYALSQDETCPALSEFKAETKEISLTYPYLWAYTQTQFSDGNSSSSIPTIISKYGRGEPAVGAILSSEAVILPCNAEGIINGTDFNVSISVVQVYDDVSTPFELADTLTKGTYNFSFSPTNISYLVRSGMAIIGQDISQMTADTAYVNVNIRYMDLYGATGTFEKTISIVRSINSETVKGVYTKIDEAADSIGLSCYKDSNGDTQFKLAGVSVGASKSDKGYVKLKGDSILMEGSVTAESLDVDSVFAKDIIVPDSYKDAEGAEHSGSIRSAAYDKDGNNATSSQGFYLNSKGVLKAVDADFSNIKINGGEIQGDDNPLNTRQKDENGNSYASKSGVSGYRKKSDIYNYVVSNAPTLTRINGNYSTLSFNGNSYSIANLQPAAYWSWDVKNDWVIDGDYANCTFELWDGNALDVAATMALSFIGLPFYHDSHYVCPATYGFLFTFADGSSSSWVTTGEFIGRIVWESSLDNLEPSSYTINVPVGAVYITIRIFKSSSYDWYDTTRWYARSNSFISYSLKDTSTYTGLVAKSGDTMVQLSTLFASLPDFLYQPAWNGTLFSSYEDYSAFGGLNLKKTLTDNTVEYENCTTSFLANIYDLELNGSAVSGEAVCSFTNTDITITQSGAVLLYLTTQSCVLTSSYPTFSFTVIAQSKGVYVDDLYPRLDSKKNYKGGGNIGGYRQEFNELHIRTVLPPSEGDGNIGNASQSFKNIYGQYLRSNSADFGSSQKVTIGQDNESGYVNIHNVDKGSDGTFWHIDACQNQLRFVRSGSTVPAYVDSDGMHGTKVFGAVFN